MAHEVPPFVALIDLWPTVADLANDLGEKYPTVAAWRQRGSIPPNRWDGVIVAAKARGIPGVTWETLARIANGQPLSESQEILLAQPKIDCDGSRTSYSNSLTGSSPTAEVVG